ncbi:MAG TPA: hypothetical protein VFW11_15440 [Cyclobacteriaceae bacterium]|nr:hypothetical protein [Cyclobacteriaceae bacterium]
MALKTLVKVGNIANLSDARYCAGMGVDLLGFTAIEGQPSYISLKLYQDIRGWVAGPAVVLELYGLKDGGSLPRLLEDYRPDYLEVGMEELDLIPDSLDQPLIVSIHSTEDLSRIQRRNKMIRYVIINEDRIDVIRKAELFDVILSLHSTSGLQLLDELPLKGVALNGSPELRPGYKDYGDLAEVLEKLEID